jgi:alpha-beta hydrolase superfamily lysophospholipase
LQIVDIVHMVTEMRTDVFGEPYAAETIALPSDDEGQVVATLVSRRAMSPTSRAVLYVHGFCDYFFQTHLSDFFVERGIDFYALDLRKYGRSIRPWQTPNFCRDLSEYYGELNVAMSVIRERDDHQHVIVNAHSTGGLVTALWADHERRIGTKVSDGFIMNSPWHDLAGSWVLRTVGTRAIGRLGRMRPYAVIPRKVTDLYVEGIHGDRQGEWQFDEEFKPASSFPVRAGWLAAIRRGHAQLHAGLDVAAPVLVLHSSRSSTPKEWNDDVQRTDTVLDVRQITKWAPYLGPQVETVGLEGAIHDVVLSSRPVRELAFAQMAGWLEANVPAA